MPPNSFILSENLKLARISGILRLFMVGEHSFKANFVHVKFYLILQLTLSIDAISLYLFDDAHQVTDSFDYQANTMRRRCGFVPACSLIQQRFRLGWGTLRSGIGMAVGAKLYSTLQNISKGSLGQYPKFSWYILIKLAHSSWQKDICSMCFRGALQAE